MGFKMSKEKEKETRYCDRIAEKHQWGLKFMKSEKNA